MTDPGWSKIKLEVDAAHSQTLFVLEQRLPWDMPARTDAGPLDHVALFCDGFRKDCHLRNVSALGATIIGKFTLEKGAEVAVELATGQRPGATAEWVNGTDVGVRFGQPINVVPLINRSLLSQPVERRSMPRVQVRCRAWMEEDGKFAAATVRNISARGLQLEAETLPTVGSVVRVFVEGLNIPPGKVVWTDGPLGGVEFEAELPWATTILWIREFSRTWATSDRSTTS